MAFFGIGGRGKDLVKSFLQTGRVRIVAFCDVDLGAHTREIREAFPDVPVFQDFRALFAECGNRFEAAVIATPDHSHFPIAMQAMAAGKHVYVEKPLAQTFQEVELLMAMAARSGVVTQMGNQGHSGNNYFQFKMWMDDGIIQNVTRVVAHMNSPRRWHGWKINGYPAAETMPPALDWENWIAARPHRAFTPRLHPGDWRAWFDFGNGAFGDWGPHILDTVHRFLALGLPHTIEAMKIVGSDDFIFPQASTVRFLFAARGVMPPVEVFWYDGVDNPPPLPAELGAGTKLTAQHGKFIYSDRLVFRGGTHGDTLRIVPEEKMRSLAPTLPRVTSVASNHYENFVLACRGIEPSRSPFEVSGPLSQVFLLGAIAARLGGKLAFDPVRKRFIDRPRANEHLHGLRPRETWAHYYKH